jgi:hypothetical protein
VAGRLLFDGVGDVEEDILLEPALTEGCVEAANDVLDSAPVDVAADSLAAFDEKFDEPAVLEDCYARLSFRYVGNDSL